MPVTDGAIVKLYWAVNGGLAMNVYGARVLSGTTFNQALADTLGAAIKSAWTAQLQAHMSLNASLVRVGVRDMRLENMPEFRDAGAAVVGTAAGDSMPAHVAACITLRTALSGKSNTGRSYISGWPESDNAASGIAAGAVAIQAIGFINAIATAMTSNGLHLAVMSRPSAHYQMIKRTFNDSAEPFDEILSNVKAKSGGVHDVIAVESRNSQWETQRRRVNGRGPSPSTLTAMVSRQIT